MTRRIPTVRNSMLYEHIEEGTSIDAIVVGSDAWHIWLEHHCSFRFEYPPNSFTARKEQRSGGWYWYAYRRRAGRLRIAYLGRSTELSVTRLDVIAASLAGEAKTRDAQVSARDQVSALHASPFQEAGTELRPRHNLPQPHTSLLGREQEAAAAEALLRRPEVRLLSMVGPPGVGKTRLALQVATDLLESYPDGVYFVSLAPLRDVDLVLSTVAQTLGLRAKGNQPVLALLKSYLHDKRCLLVLDNFEHVVTAAPLLADLCEMCLSLKLLVTSREALHLSGEYKFPVPPLAAPDLIHLPEQQILRQVAAVRLFVERAQAIQPTFQLTQANARTIAEICVRLDGLPLAIELAAARIKLLPPQALLHRLSHRLDLLTGGARDLPSRQQTLLNTIAWSYNLLTCQEQHLFQHLSVFVGGCTLETAEAICTALGDTAGWVLDGLASLIDKSLLQQREQEGEEPRFMMLETIREYGWEALATSGEMEVTRQAHATYYLQLAEQARLEMRGPNQATWLQRLEQEHDNLRAALEWTLEEAEEQGAERRELALRLSAALKALWMEHGHYREARTFLERVLARSEGECTSLRARALRVAAHVAIMQGEHDRAEELAQQSLALCRVLNDTPGIARSLFVLGNATWSKGKTSERLSILEERVRLARQIGEPEEAASALYYLAFELSLHGEYVRGQSLFEEALELFRKADNELWVGATLVESANMLWFCLGDAATIHQRLQEGRTLINKVGNRHWSAWSLCITALVALREGETDSAASLARECLAIYREMDARWYIAWLLHVLGRIEAQRGDLSAASSSYQESLVFTHEPRVEWITPFNLEGLAGVGASQGAFRWAAQLWGASEALREVIAVPLMPADRAGYDQAVYVVRAKLGEQAFAKAWAQGRAMPLEQVITYALETKGALPADAQPSEAKQKGASSIVPSGTLSPPPKRYSSVLKQHFGGLTSREREVARLVAQGKSNRAIAGGLVVGVSTVETHISHIFTKLGFSSRAQIAAWAVDKGLVQAPQEGEDTRQKP